MRPILTSVAIASLLVASAALAQVGQVSASLDIVSAPLTPPALGNKVHANTTSGTSVAGTISSASSKGVLVACVTTNFPVTGNSISAASSTLGSWGSARTFQLVSGAANQSIVEFTAPFSSSLTSEVVTISYGAAISFATLDVFEVENAPNSGYFDGSPVGSNATPSDPLSISTTNANTLIFGCFRVGVASPTAGTGFTPVSGADFQLVEEKTVTTTQSGLSILIGTGVGTSNASVGDAIK